MSDFPVVSVVMIFLNEERFIREAIESVINQTYSHWELLLVDDGSSDSSTNIAREFASLRPEQIYYLTHPGQENRGMSASRNVGIQKAKGKYIAFLDADDVWLPNKLEDQVRILDTYPDVSMVYGKTLYWYSWDTKSDNAGLDFVPNHGFQGNAFFMPPKLLPLYLSGIAAIPCVCSIIIRHSVFNEIGGFENQFKNLYEDQAFYAKICLEKSIFVAYVCWDKYRQHPHASTAIAKKNDQETLSRQYFLKWLVSYLDEENVKDLEVWISVYREIWLIETSGWLNRNGTIQNLVRWTKKWLLRVEAVVLPHSIRSRIWMRESATDRAAGE